MKTRLLQFLVPFLSIALLPLSLVPTGCANSTPASRQQAVATGLGLAQLAVNTYFGYKAATSNGAQPSTAQTQALAQNALNGVGTLLQAYNGQSLSSPVVQQNVIAGAGNPVVGAAVVNALDQGTINQATINQVFAAAQKAPAVAPVAATPGSGARYRRPIYYAGRKIEPSFHATVVTSIRE